jgi:hypothetical protein
MLHELIERLKKWAKETTAALKAKLTAAAHSIRLPVSAGFDARTLIAALEGNVLNVGKRYRLTSSHAPLFSLYTFFGKRHN